MDYPVIVKPSLEEIKVRPNIGEYGTCTKASPGSR